MKILEIYGKILPFMRMYPWTIPLVIILGVISSLLDGIGIGLLIPFVNSIESEQFSNANNIPFINLIDGFLTNVDSGAKPFLIGAILITAILLKIIVAYLHTVQIAWLRTWITYSLRCNIFNQLLNVGQEFWDKTHAGDLLNTLNQEVHSAGNAIDFFIRMVMAACMIVTFSVLLLIVSWPLTLISILSLGLVAMLARWMTRRVRSLGGDRVSINIQLKQASLETINGMNTIRAFNHENYEQQRFESKARCFRDLGFRIYLLSALIEPLFEGVCLIMLIGLFLSVLFTQSSVPLLVTMILILSRLQPQIKNFDNNRLSLLSIERSLDKLHSMLSTVDKPYIKSGVVPHTGLKEAIRFRSVSFSYDRPEGPALHNVNLTIRKGETTAFVGPSGAGKSTLISLICRFYDVTDGQIEIDGKPLSSLNLSDWRERFALISQHVHIFNTTIEENIAYGRLEATREEIIDAAKQANAHEFICRLPQGYDTSVGDRGIRLSGGQIQRLAIARAILRNPDILILDEATNALDSISENLIQQSLYRLSQNRTVLIIAHRLSTIEHADQIVVLEDGQIKDTNTFGELLKKKDGLFTRMYQLQNT